MLIHVTPWPRPARPVYRSGLEALALLVSAAVLGVGCGSTRAEETDRPAMPVYTLKAAGWWLLDPPGGRRFDASALLRRPTGEWWVLNDQVNGVFRFEAETNAPVATVTQVPDLLTPDQLSGAGLPGNRRWDGEGLAQDVAGRVYLCGEAQRRILRWDPGTRRLERLPIDWAPVAKYFHPTDANASFEGIAVGGARLYVANERQTARILVVDLDSLRVIDDFAVRPADSIGDDVQYSDLCWAEESLWVLLRDVRRVLRVDPQAKRVLAEYDYGPLETAREVAYGAFYAPGFMEGLWVDGADIWLLTDNNGFGRRADRRDTRPTLFRCPRPDVPGSP